MRRDKSSEQEGKGRKSTEQMSASPASSASVRNESKPLQTQLDNGAAASTSLSEHHGRMHADEVPLQGDQELAGHAGLEEPDQMHLKEEVVLSEEAFKCPKLAAYEAGRLLNWYWFHESQGTFFCLENEMAARVIARQLALRARILRNTEIDSIQTYILKHVHYWFSADFLEGSYDPYYDRDQDRKFYDPATFKGEIIRDLAKDGQIAFRLGELVDR